MAKPLQSQLSALLLVIVAVLAIEILVSSQAGRRTRFSSRWRLGAGQEPTVVTPSDSSEESTHFKQSQPKPVCGYESCPVLDPMKLNVHMIPHTHDDVGWVRTIDEYYYGSTHKREGAVQYIIDSVVSELLEDPSRRFVYVETAYLWKWWQEQDETRREQVKELINNGQLEIIGGAWSMNDEAVTHYQSIIDQFTWGLRVLNDTLGECARPRAAWQIDPFGHSREMASLFSQMGYDGLFVARIHFRDKFVRLHNHTAELVWQGSPDNLGQEGDLFTHVLFDHYFPPHGFCFDVFCNDEPLIDNKNSPSYNIPRKVDAFLQHVSNQAFFYNTSNIILTMGQDFSYQDANIWYRNMDKLIKYVNAQQLNGSSVNVLYSTPSCYLKAVHEAGLEWSIKQDDFLPYASDFMVYWTGFYTSKPTIKYFERFGNNFLQVCKQTAALAGTSEQENQGVTALREAMGVMQHHDAITGTMKDHVAHDYSKLLYSAIDQCSKTVQTALNEMTKKDKSEQVQFISCLKLNVSECATSESSSKFVVTVWNPLSHPTAHYVRLPVHGFKFIIQDANYSNIPSEILRLHNQVMSVPGRNGSALYELIFLAQDLPPLGYRSYHVMLQPRSGALPASHLSRDTSISNQHVTLQLDGSGLTKLLKMNGMELNIKQSFRYYSSNEIGPGKPSGAYIFRPNGTSTTDIPLTSFYVYKGDAVEEVHQVFGEGWVSQVIRIYKDENHVELEWMVGPIPPGDSVEVISLFETELQTNGTFYTDSNGRELLKRVRDAEQIPSYAFDAAEPIASNYYPVTSRILLRDETRQQEVAVLVDRAQGGSSIKDGQIELMLHRRLYYDDGFGVNEALNEKQFGSGLVARGKHFLLAGPLTGISPSLAVQERLLAQRKLLNPWVFLSPTELSHSEWISQYNMEYRSVKEDALPPQVQILTLEPWRENSLLLRLEHIMERTDDPELSSPVTVNLIELLSLLPVVVVEVRETTLGANQFLDEAQRLRWKTHPTGKEGDPHRGELNVTAVPLAPMKIRSFVVTVVRK